MDGGMMNPGLLHWLLYTGAIGLIVIGLVGVVTLHNIFRIVLSVVIAEAGANLLLVIAGFRFDAFAPILTEGLSIDLSQNMVDPVPQAMVLTAIVIGVGIQALVLALAVRVYQHYQTLDLREIHQRMISDIDSDMGVKSLSSPGRVAGERPTPAQPPASAQQLEDQS